MADPLVVLVHGAWGAPGLWEYLVAELDAAGIRSATADLPTMGSATATLADDADHVRAVAGDGPVVLVGHSYGGAVIAEAALGLDATHLVYLASVVLEEGESFFDWLVKRDAGGSPLDFRDDGTAMVTQWGNPDHYGAAVLDLFARNPPRPFAVGAAVTPLAGAPWRTVDSTLVVATEDTVIHPDTQRETGSRARRVVELDGDHLVQGTHPRRVARVVMDALGR
ncbi:MAG TPA: alpha/beta hydrolase [Microthrixaceae bacterium]|nr:alpha/beta hydrolase [Microthrixaceae bacterium]MCB9402401.1 alpha/beta hydrolase [Microthrixaceae bacterium]HPG15750.1 alpha/beta hydrolase [Microthrixaceae bacterium]HRW41482.1 alpha/beta hydrolase [Microthrixaceae bacterium]